MLASLFDFAGGLALLLLGMRLLTDGLRIAAGPALRALLARATGSRWRALASGTLITALVHSSSAVTVATIGFVNAGLLSLGQAVGLVFGANLGTTFSAWIVALVGFDIDLAQLAMPLLALGMAVWLGRAAGRRAAFGQALVGVGLFLLGLDALKGGFADLGDGVPWLELQSRGALGVVVFCLLGVALTMLMQSSTAALALTLTAAAGGLVPVSAAAAVVIGANIGTTSTAVFAAFGATAAARRVAAAHVVFNIVLALIALPTLPWLVDASAALVQLALGDAQPASELAVLHTLANLVCVIVMWPLTPRLVDWLEQHFGRREADLAEPRYLDRHVLGTPRLALDALRMELARLIALGHRIARAALSSEGHEDPALAGELDAVERLGEAIIGFAAGVNSGGDAVVETALPSAVRVVQYCRGLSERAVELARIATLAEAPAALAAQLAALRHLADDAFDASAPDADGRADGDGATAAARTFEDCYQQTKAELLRAGSRGELTPAALVRALDRASALRRVVDQASKAARYLALLPAPA